MGTILMRRKQVYRKPKKLERFYKSDEWHLARAIKIANQNGLRENCGKPGNEVHHIIHLTINNVDDPNVSLNQNNLKLLCTDCHNKEHHRFGRFDSYYFDANGDLKHKSK